MDLGRFKQLGDFGVSQILQPRDYRQFSVTPRTPVIGGWIENFHLGDLNDTVAQAKTTTDIWHHDVSARKHPNIMSILQADQVAFGADTMWSSMTPL